MRLTDRLLSPLGLKVAGVGMVLTLVAVFPARHLLDEEAPDADNDRHAALLYAQARLNSAPDELDNRMAVARLQIASGDYLNAEHTLAPVEASTRPDVRWALLEVKWGQYLASSPDVREQQLPALSRALHQYAQQMVAGDESALPERAVGQLNKIASWWLNLGEPAQAAACYELLGDRADDQRVHWYGEAARVWLQANRPERSAEAWHKAWRLSTDDAPMASLVQWVIPAAMAAEITPLEAARRSLTAALQADDSRQAMRYAREYLAHDPQDAELLKIGIGIALDSDEPEQAYRWSADLLALDPDDLEGVQRHAALAMGLGHLDEATRLLKSLHEREPDDLEHLRSLADVERWNGNPAAALKYEQELAERTRTPQDLRKVAALAIGLSDYPASRQALEQLQRTGAMNITDRTRYIHVLDHLGYPDVAISVLRDWQQHDLLDANLMARLATFLEQTGQLKASSDAWAALSERFKSQRSVTAMDQSRVLIKRWDFKGALAVLNQVAPPSDPEPRADYWQKRALLATTLGDRQDMVVSLSHKSLATPLESWENNQLMQAASEDRDLELVTRLARQRWHQQQDGPALLRAVQLALELGQPEEARELMKLAKQHPDKVESLAEYWSVRASLALRDHRNHHAIEIYRQALVRFPDHRELAAGGLQAMAAAGELDLLREHLKRWDQEGRNSLVMAEAVATGYRTLGDTARATHWYRYMMANYPADSTRQIVLADLMRKAGHGDEAFRLRRHALSELAPELIRQLDQLDDRDRLQAQIDALGASREQMGAEQSTRWHDLILARLAPLASSDEGNLAQQTLAGMDQTARQRYLWRVQKQFGQTPNISHTLQVAISRRDTATLTRLLEQREPALQLDERFLAYSALGRDADALRVAEQLQAGGNDMRSEIASLRRELPERASVTVSHQEISDLEIEQQQAMFETSSDDFTSRLTLGTRQLDSDGTAPEVDADGLENERYLELSSKRRDQDGAGSTRLSLGSVASDADSRLTASLRRDWNWSDNLNLGLFASYNQTTDASDLLRLLAVEDRVGMEFGWQLTARDQLSMTAYQRQFSSMDSRESLAEGSVFDAQWRHAVISGARYRLETRVFANHESSDLASSLPEETAARLTSGSTIGSLFSDDSSYVGGGFQISRGLPGSAYPQVASPRMSLDVSGGYRMPTGVFSTRVGVGLGASILGGDELSLEFTADDGTGVDDATRLGSALTYQMFLGS